MVVVGADVHKRTHTFVAVDGVGRKLGEKVVAATSVGHAEAVMWARERFGPDVVWAIEDCRHLSARLERDLLSAGQQVVRIPPKLMAQTRASARTRGKSDPIDALAVARGHSCVNPIFRSRRMMRPHASSSSWLIGVKILSRNALRRSIACCGGCMNLIPNALPSHARWIWPSTVDSSVSGWQPSTGWSPSWPAMSWPTSPGSPRRSTRWPNELVIVCASWHRCCWRCQAVGS